MTPDWARELFATLAVPRLPGTPALADATDATAALLHRWGFHVTRQELSVSPRRLTAASLGAAGIGWSALLAIPLLVLPMPGWIVLLVIVGLLGLVGVVAGGVMTDQLPIGPPPVAAENVVATLGVGPRWWLVAHLDSKSQRFSMRARVIAVTAVGVGLLALGVLLVLRLAGPLPWPPVFVVAGLVTGGAGVLSAGEAGNASPGAVDNASGVIAVLAAAETVRGRDDVGILLTSGEEFGMEGARVWCARGRSGEAFTNVDGLDGRGSYRVWPHRGCGRDPANSLAAALAETGVPVRVGRLAPGILVDGVTLAAAGMIGSTVSRGDWSTLGAVHTARDVKDRVDLSAVVDAGRALGRWVALQVR